MSVTVTRSIVVQVSARNGADTLSVYIEPGGRGPVSSSCAGAFANLQDVDWCGFVSEVWKAAFEEGYTAAEDNRPLPGTR